MSDDCGHTLAEHEATLLAHNDQARARITDWIVYSIDEDVAGWRTALDVLADMIYFAAESPASPLAAPAPDVGWCDDSLACLACLAACVTDAVTFADAKMLDGEVRADMTVVFMAIAIANDLLDGEVQAAEPLTAVLAALSERDRIALAAWTAALMRHLGFGAAALAALASRADHVMASTG